MHQEDEIDIFDLKVRELLENAEEKVPARVWDAVSSRLATGVSVVPTSSRRWMWAAASLAVAASLVALLLLPGGRVEQAHTCEISDQVAQVQHPELSSDDVLEVVPDPATRSFMPFNASGINSSVADSGIVESDDTVSFREGAADTEIQTEGAYAAGVGKEESEPSVPVTVKTPESTDNSLLAMAWPEDDEKSGFADRLSIGMDGTLNVNDSRVATGMDARAHMTSGTSSHTTTSIEEESVSAYDIPLSFGLGVRYQFAPRFSVGTGLMYSLIGRTFSGTYYESKEGALVRELSGDIRHTMHYLGVPVNFYFDFLQTKSIDCYAYAGGTAEFCVSNRYSIEDVVFHDPVNNPQFSVGVGLGVQFRVTEHLGIYIDPGVRYYFRCGQPKSIRTDQPVMVNFEAGLRFNL